MNHLEFAYFESASLEDTPWDRWIAALEHRLGHDLDGTEWVDGYSLDGCHDRFRAGMTVEEAAKEIEAQKELVR